MEIELETIHLSCMRLDMNKILRKGLSWFSAIVTVVFTIGPEVESLLSPWVGDFAVYIAREWESCPISLDKLNIMLLSKILLLVIILILSISAAYAMSKFRDSVTIKRKNYCIKVMYGDLLKQRGKKVISFDECFTTKVGNSPEDIKPLSLCGQYLELNPIQDMQSLIDAAGLKPEREGSKYKSQARYRSG